MWWIYQRWPIEPLILACLVIIIRDFCIVFVLGFLFYLFYVIFFLKGVSYGLAMIFSPTIAGYLYHDVHPSSLVILPFKKTKTKTQKQKQMFCLIDFFFFLFKRHFSFRWDCYHWIYCL